MKTIINKNTGNERVIAESAEELLEKSGKTDLKKFKKKIKDWLYVEDEEVLEIVLASVISERLGGDPVWLFLIAPPGGSKTELLRSFDGEYSHHLSDMTSRTLISGLMIGTGEKRRKIEDLLPHIDGKVLIFKDFTTILEKGRDERREIISQFREAYDGSLAKKVGTVDKTITHKSRFGLIAGVTPIIDKHWKILQQLGERFLKVRWVQDVDKSTKKAFENEGKEVNMRKELVSNSNSFIKSLDFSKIPIFPEKFEGDIFEIAKFVSIARTPISIQANREEFYFDYIPMPEVPTRLVKQFKKMARCLALVRGKEEVDLEDIRTVLRVAKDTIPPDRMAILEAIRANSNSEIGCSRAELEEVIKIPNSSIRLIIEQLKMLELVSEFKDYYGIKVFYRLSAISPNIFCNLQQKLGDSVLERPISAITYVSLTNKEIPLPNGSMIPVSGTTIPYDFTEKESKLFLDEKLMIKSGTEVNLT